MGKRGGEHKGPADQSAPTGLRLPSPPAQSGDRASAARPPDDARSGTTLGVVLAGGLSRRMGALGPKAALPIGGEALLERVVRRLRAAGLANVLVVGPPDVLRPLVPNLPVAADRRPGAHGPLAGLETALTWALAARAQANSTSGMPLALLGSEGDEGRGQPALPYSRAFVVACDMPFVAPVLVRAMVERAGALPEVDALVLRSASGTEQLHAIYALACLPVASDLLDAGARSLRELLARVRVAEFSAAEAARFDPTGLSAFNANTPEDWQRALDIVASERGEETQEDVRASQDRRRTVRGVENPENAEDGGERVSGSPRPA